MTEEERNELATKGFVHDAVAESAALLRVDMERGFARLMEAILTVQRSIAPTVIHVFRTELLPAFRAEVLDIVHTEVRTAVGITEEEWQRHVAVLDEKYKDLPPRVSAVEDDLEAHKRDFRLHKRPPVP